MNNSLAMMYAIRKIERLIIEKSKCHNIDNIIKNIYAKFHANITFLFKATVPFKEANPYVAMQHLC